MPSTAICVQILSDIHAEHAPHALPRPADVDTDADIVIIAGDLAAAPVSVATAAWLFPAAPALVLVGGNHEHYRTDLAVDEGLDRMCRMAAETSLRDGRALAVLEDTAATFLVRGTTVRVLGSTLWTDYSLRHQPITACERLVNDHRSIRGRDTGQFTVREAAARHQASRVFLAGALAREHDGPPTVVTHHLPSMRSVAGRFRRQATSSAFASHADDLVGLGAALWVHGHTHDSITWEDGGGTLVACNPAGYARPDGTRENASFNPRLCVTLQDHGGAWHAMVEGHPPA